MAYDSRVYRILIASPSDVEEEREIAVKVIQEWNDLYSYTRKVVLLPLRWETHTAPEYGTRPQEVINRAIVDQCDLLVGVFWTRIGSPTGEADSGTLEEIKRVGTAGKPIMLYFSKVGIDPNQLDLDQVKQLSIFKEKTYPKSLTESYKSIIEFRDKFAKQLELKVRDLQREEDAGLAPLTISFFSAENGQLLGNKLKRDITVPIIIDLEKIEKEYKKEKSQGILNSFVKQKIKETVSVPVILAIKNTSSSGVNNLYVEIEIKSSTSGIEVLKSIVPSVFLERPMVWDTTFATTFGVDDSQKDELAMKLAQYEDTDLNEDEGKWRFSFEWGAIQPQRTKLIKPHVYVLAKETSNIEFIAKVYADGFPQPLILNATLEINAKESKMTVDQFTPKIRAGLSEIRKRTQNEDESNSTEIKEIKE